MSLDMHPPTPHNGTGLHATYSAQHLASTLVRCTNTSLRATPNPCTGTPARRGTGTSARHAAPNLPRALHQPRPTPPLHRHPCPHRPPCPHPPLLDQPLRSAPPCGPKSTRPPPPPPIFILPASAQAPPAPAPGPAPALAKQSSPRPRSSHAASTTAASLNPSDIVIIAAPRFLARCTGSPLRHPCASTWACTRLAIPRPYAPLPG